MLDKEIQSLANAINEKYAGIKHSHMSDMFRDVIENAKSRYYRENNPEFTDQTIGPQPYVINYKNRKHLFMYTPTSFTGTMQDLGTVSFVAGNWYNMSFRPGTTLTVTSVASVNVLLKATDEIVP